MHMPLWLDLEDDDDEQWPARGKRATVEAIIARLRERAEVSVWDEEEGEDDDDA